MDDKTRDPSEEEQMAEMLVERALAETPRDTMSPEERVIRDWLDGQVNPDTGGPLTPSRRTSTPLPRRQVAPVVAALIDIIDDLRAALTSPTPDAAPRLRAETLAAMEGMPPEKVAEWTAETLRQRSPTPDAAWPTTAESRVRNQASLDALASPTPDANKCHIADYDGPHGSARCQHGFLWVDGHPSPTPDAALDVERDIMLTFIDNAPDAFCDLTGARHADLVERRVIRAAILAARGQQFVVEDHARPRRAR